MKRKHKLGIYLIIVLAAFLYFFVATPIINPLYPQGAFFWAVLITIFIAVNQIVNLKGLKIENHNGMVAIDYDKTKPLKKWAVLTVIVIWIAYFGVMIVSSPLFFYKAYRDQLGEATYTEFSSDMQAIDTNQIPIVDADLAKKLAEKKLGEKPSLGSQVELGDPTIQNVNNKLVWAVPLHHSGFFKWITNLEGSAGYIVVSATNQQDVQYVDDYKIKIQPNSYLMDDLLRHIRFGAGAFTGTTDYSFELDDEGNPYWVVTTFKNLRGFALPEADGIILVNAQNGEMKQYGIDEIPQWIDRVQPEDFIIDQINHAGEYVHGIFNFANTDKTQTSEGHSIIYNNGRCYLFTGITSVGADESAIGFMMVDMVTKEPIFYSMSGATEKAAMESAAGKVQDLGYYATFPLILNIEGQPTYFMTLKDNSGLIKKYAFVSIKNYNVVGVGDSASAAQNDYLKAMSDTNSIDFNEGEETQPLEQEKLSGSVDRISWNIVDGETEYTMTLTEYPEKIFIVKSKLSAELPITQSGDSISLTYEVPLTGSVCNVVEFENHTIG